jgi:hypothetical protein
MTTREDVVQLVRSFVGLSEDHDPESELARLVDFPGGAPPEVEVHIHTNCAMFADGIWRELGCNSPLLHHQYVNGAALTWALEIAREANALHLPNDGTPGIGDVLHFATPPKPGVKNRNDDHLIFVVDGPDERGMILRAGGGGARNLIAESTKRSTYKWDLGRPLRHWVETLKLL